MSKVAASISLGTIALDRASAVPLHRQLYESLRAEILQGQLRPGTRLPSTRTLAQELTIARNTVIVAYDQLISEGYLESKVGLGTHVTHTLPDTMLRVDMTERGRHKNEHKKSGQHDTISQNPPRMSERGAAIVQIPYTWEENQPRAFCSTLPAVDCFPFKLWEKLLVASWRSLSSNELAYQSALGYKPLRTALTAYLQTARGVKCTPEQVVITTGAQQALTMIANMLLNRDDPVWVENPCYNGFKAAMRGVRAKIHPVRVDEQGLVVHEGIAQAPDARLCLISPAHQYPLGVTMSLTRRLELLQWARQVQAWIVEDDYDSEYRYDGSPIAALQRLDNSGQIIYVGTFSKVLFPALRIGYMVVPPALVEPVHAARAHTDRGATLLEQVVLTRFIVEDHLARHIRRMRAIYVERQAAFVDAAQTNLAGLLEVAPKDTGLHIVGWLPDGVDDQIVSQKLLENGIDAPALSSFAITPLARSGLVMGYAAVPVADIIAAVKKMKEVLAGCLEDESA